MNHNHEETFSIPRAVFGLAIGFLITHLICNFFMPYWWVFFYRR